MLNYVILVFKNMIGQILKKEIILKQAQHLCAEDIIVRDEQLADKTAIYTQFHSI